MTLRIEIHEGPAALAAMDRGEISDGWSTLYERCPWGTVGQRLEFVATWYRHYGDLHQPVLVLGFDEDEVLRGVLPLSRWNGGREYRYGGHVDSEYEAWLADCPAGENFLSAAVEALDRSFGRVHLRLGYLPHGTPLDQIQDSPQLRARTRLQTEPTLVLETGEPDFAATYRSAKKNARALSNRLRRRHGMKLLSFTEVEDVRAVMPRFQALYDFRRGNTKDLVVFGTDTRKLPFLLELASHGLLHVSALELDGEVVAMHVCSFDERRMPLAGLVHSDFAHNHSVGLALLFELIQEIANEGVRVFDMTPGGDSYKSRFSKQVETVHILELHASKLSLAQAEALQFAKRARRWLGRRVRAAAARLTGSTRAGGGAQPPMERLEVSPRSTLEEVTPPEVAGSSDAEWRLNDERDLASIDPGNPAHFRFLRWTGRNVRRGAQTLSKTDNGRLARVWFRIPAKHAHEEIDLAALRDLPAESTLLVEYPLTEGLSTREDLQTVISLMPPSGAGPVYVLVPPEAPYAGTGDGSTAPSPLTAGRRS